MDIRVNQVETSPTSLRLGCVVNYSENGPIRFVVVEVPLSLLRLEVRAALVQAFNEDAHAPLIEEPLF